MTGRLNRPARAALAGVVPLLAGAIAAAATPAAAQSAPPRPPSFLAVGVGSVPEYEGANERQVVPVVIGTLQLGPATLRLNGLAAQLNVLPPAARGWALGPSIQFRPGRDRDVDDPVVARLREIDDAVEVGGFVEYAWANVGGPGDRFAVNVEVLRDINDAHDGVIGRAIVSYGFAPVGAWRFGVRAGVAYGNRAYMNTYFSVDGDNSARSGLRQYQARRGIKDASLILTASYALPSKWLVTGFAGGARLVGDAADSPIVTERGRRDEWVGGLALGRRF